MHGSIFEDFVAAARHAAAQEEPGRSIRAFLRDSLTQQEELSTAIAAMDEDEALLFEDQTCSVWSCRYAPDVVLAPHEHCMPVHIAVYQGTEVEVLYKREPGQLRHGGNKQVNAGDVVSLGADAIHAITAEGTGKSHAIHIYEGALTQKQRSLFDWGTGKEVEFSMENFHTMKRQKTDMDEFR